MINIYFAMQTSHHATLSHYVQYRHVIYLFDLAGSSYLVVSCILCYLFIFAFTHNHFALRHPFYVAFKNSICVGNIKSCSMSWLDIAEEAST